MESMQTHTCTDMFSLGGPFNYSAFSLQITQKHLRLDKQREGCKEGIRWIPLALLDFWSHFWRGKALWKQMFPLSGFFNQRMGCSTHSLIILQFWTAGMNEWKIMRNEDRESVVGGEWGKGAVMECDEEIRTQGRGCWQLWRRAREGEWVLTAALIYAAIMSEVTGS